MKFSLITIAVLALILVSYMQGSRPVIEVIEYRNTLWCLPRDLVAHNYDKRLYHNEEGTVIMLIPCND